MLSTAVIEEMPESTKRDNSVRRDRSIRLAVVTSLVSKVGSVLLQLLSIPLAVRVLGREEFGLYTLVSLTLGTVSLLEIGVGPALTHGLSKARATNDEGAIKRLSSTSFFLMLVMAFAVASLMALVISTIPYPTLFGEKFAGKEHILRPALWTGLGLFLSLFVLNLTERIREGYLEVATTNLWGAAGNVMGAIFVGAGIWFFHDVWFLVLAVQGAAVLSKIGNTIMCWRKHPLTAPSLKSFDRSLVKGLMTDGLSFTACFVLSGLVEMNFCGWMIGRFGGGPSEVALFGVFMTLTVMQLGFVVMLSTPTWPAVAEALARGDKGWARNAARRLYLFGGGFAALAGLGLVTVGPWAMSVWLGKSFAGTDHGILACYALYFIAHVWRHLNHALMIGTGQVKRLAVIQIFETSLMIPAVFISLRFGGLGAMLLAMTATIVLTTGWILPRRVHQVLVGKN